MEQEKNSHESFGLISFSRINSNGTRFYGSELTQDNYIQLTISESEQIRDLTCDRHYPKKHLVQLRLTSNQFAELITSMNVGSGVPCTIEYLPNKRVENLPTVENRKELVHRKFKNRMSEFSSKIKDKRDAAKELVKKKTLSKEDIRELSNYLDYLTTEIDKNIPFFGEMFQETMDKVVSEAKSEIESAIQHKINVLGLNELRKQNDLLLEK